MLSGKNLRRFSWQLCSLPTAGSAAMPPLLLNPLLLRSEMETEFSVLESWSPHKTRMEDQYQSSNNLNSVLILLCTQSLLLGCIFAKSPSLSIRDFPDFFSITFPAKSVHSTVISTIQPICCHIFLPVGVFNDY